MSDTSRPVHRNRTEQAEAWQATLHGALRPSDALRDAPRPPVQCFLKAHVRIDCARLADLSAREGVSLAVAALAAMGLQAARYAGVDEAVIGSLSAESVRASQTGPPQSSVSPEALRIDLTGNPTIRELLHRVSRVMQEGAPHRDYPVERLIEQAAAGSGRQSAPLFNTLLISRDLTGGASASAGSASPGEVIADYVAPCDLSLQITANDTSLSLNYEYDTELFERSTIERMASRLHTLLEEMVANPEQRIDRRSLRTPDRRRARLVECNDAWANSPSDQFARQLFEEQVRRTPEAVALVFEEQQLTYRELNVRADQLAHHLKSLGVGPQVRVGLCVQHSLEMVVGLLGIFKAGGTYVPPDPASPRDRLDFTTEDARLSPVITLTDVLSCLPDSNARLLCLDAEALLATYSCEDTVYSAVADNLAYVIFTPGSTGHHGGVDAAAHARRDQRERLRASMDQLTPREKQVFALVVTGKLNKQIAARLGITQRTVKAHRAQVMKKLRVTSVAELVRIATQLDPIRPQSF